MAAPAHIQGSGFSLGCKGSPADAFDKLALLTLDSHWVGS
ncbi:hypothetical protein HKBW3S43_01984, partial [Candidatus Hakubella thermalkaliphila]